MARCSSIRPWSDRRAALQDLDLPARRVLVASVYGWEQIPDLFRACAALGVEGIVLEYLKGRYMPVKRSDVWRKGEVRRVAAASGPLTVRGPLTWQSSDGGGIFSATNHCGPVPKGRSS
jgi:hypothetical protein